MAKHFIKTLIIFSVMIIIGLICVFLSSYFNNGGNTVTSVTSGLQSGKVAK